MNTNEWKSISTKLDVYKKVRTLAKDNGRSISGQLEMAVNWYLETANYMVKKESGEMSQKSGKK